MIVQVIRFGVPVVKPHTLFGRQVEWLGNLMEILISQLSNQAF